MALTSWEGIACWNYSPCIYAYKVTDIAIQSYNPWRPFAGDKETGLEIYRLGNDDLTYEKKHELNLGLPSEASKTTETIISYRKTT